MRMGVILRAALWVSSALVTVASFSSIAEEEAKETVLRSAQVEFCDRIQYAGIAVREPRHHVWGCSPVKDDKGKYHLFGARFGNPFKNAWRSDSHIVHYVSDTPQGRFRFSEVVYRGERKRAGQWNYFGIHNPTIKKVDGKYVLFFIANSNKGKKSIPGNQSIGVITADSPNGPWSEPKQILTPSEDPGHWTYQAGNGVCNPAFVKMPNGKYHLYYKSSKCRYGVAIADKVMGPYIHYREPVTRNDRVIEDGYAFLWRGKVCLITTDNHGTIQRGGGLVWKSENGLAFASPTRAYYVLDRHVSQEEYPRTHGAKGKRIKRYSKIVRPQILMEDGRPAWLYAPSTGCYAGREYTDCLVYKVLTDEEVAKAKSRPSKSSRDAEGKGSR